MCIIMYCTDHNRGDIGSLHYTHTFVKVVYSI